MFFHISDTMNHINPSNGIEITDTNPLNGIISQYNEYCTRYNIGITDKKAILNVEDTSGIVYIQNSSSIPEGLPIDGGFIFSFDGILMYKGSNGTITSLASS